MPDSDLDNRNRRSGNGVRCYYALKPPTRTSEEPIFAGRLSRSEAFEGYRMTVLFDSVGYKTLSVPVVVQQQLLVGE
jgi:hypothetical protein